MAMTPSQQAKFEAQREKNRKLRVPTAKRYRPRPERPELLRWFAALKIADKQALRDAYEKAKRKHPNPTAREEV